MWRAAFAVLGLALGCDATENREVLGRASSGPNPRAVRALGPECPSRCSVDHDCPAGLGCFGEYCYAACLSDADCGPQPEWYCAPGWLASGGACQCEPTGAELCDGRDNDCNGEIDDQASCSGAGEECVAATCVCPPARTCAGGCVDTLLDPQHCGACGHACPGVANGRPLCALGKCTFICDAAHGDCDGIPQNGCEASAPCPVTTLSKIAADSRGLAVHGAFVYWTEHGPYGAPGHVRAATKDGGQALTVAEAPPDLSSITAGTDGVYWIQKSSLKAYYGGRGEIVRVTEPAAPPEIVHEESTWAPLELDVTADAVAWSAYAACGHWCGTESSIAVRDHVTTSLFRISAFHPHASAPRLVGRHLFFEVSGTLFRARRDCDRPMHVTSAQDYGTPTRSELRVDESSVYWASPADAPGVRRLARYDRAGVFVQELAPSPLWRVVLDGSSVYYARESRIERVPKSGGAAVVLAEGQTATELAVDDTHVYWLDVSSGERWLRKVRK